MYQNKFEPLSSLKSSLSLYHNAPAQPHATILLAALLATGGSLQTANAQDDDETPFKVAKIYFETNASACDMGIQIVFDTEGIKSGKVKDSDGNVIHDIRARSGLEDISGQTERFLESVEPVILDLVEDPANECEPDPEEDMISFADLQEAFPAGFYEFEGRSADGEIYDDEAELTFDIPAGPVLGYPNELGNRDPYSGLFLTWEKVVDWMPGLPEPAGNPNIIGYQILVYDANAGESPQEFNVTVPGWKNSVSVSRQFLRWNTVYAIEVLAIEESNNQTITEGYFCTKPIPTSACEFPE